MFFLLIYGRQFGVFHCDILKFLFLYCLQMSLNCFLKLLFLVSFLHYISCFGLDLLFFSSLLSKFICIIWSYEHWIVFFWIKLCCKGASYKAAIVACLNETVSLTGIRQADSIVLELHFTSLSCIKFLPICSWAIKLPTRMIWQIRQKFHVFWLSLVSGCELFNEYIHSPWIRFECFHHWPYIQLFSFFWWPRHIYKCLKMAYCTTKCMWMISKTEGLFWESSLSHTISVLEWISSCTLKSVMSEWSLRYAWW